MKKFLFGITVLISGYGCHKDPPPPPHESHFYDLRFRVVGTDYPIAVTRIIGDSMWTDTITHPMDTIIYQVPGQTKVSLEGNAYTDSNIRMRVALAWDYFHGIEMVYPPNQPKIKLEVTLPE